MPKRKRDGSESPQEGGDEEQGKSLRQRRVEHKLDQGYKLLNRAFRLAKGFERQKLGRRRKTAAEKGDAQDVVRIDAETEAIKTLDFSAAARNYLHKTLLKFKAISESPELPKNVAKPPAPIGDAAKANVVARLCNSNPVKDALPPILKDVQQALGLKISEEALKGKKRLRAKDFEKDAQKEKKPKRSEVEDEDVSDIADDDGELASRLKGVMQRRPHSDNEDDLIDDDDEDDEEQEEHDPADDYDSEDFSKFKGRIAASSDDDSDDSSKKDKSTRVKSLRAAIKSRSPEPDRSYNPTKSAFIPSLSMGGYWSGSESEPEDDDIDVAPRKNRRGQRARQLINEKKFGQAAKHLQKEGAVSQKERNQGWDPKRGATDRSGQRGRGGPQKFGRGALGMENEPGMAPPPPPKKHRDDAGPLHPSWEAAKKAKEAKATAPYQGKKITFD